MTNPYYDPAELGLDMISLDEPDMVYEFNILCFWATSDGRVYSASDSGCSCPTPFERYSGDTLDGVLQTLERIGCTEQAERIIDAWGHCTQEKKQQASNWVKSKLAMKV